MRKRRLLLVLTATCMLLSNAYASTDNDLCRAYPHWNCKDPKQKIILMKIEQFIKDHPQRGIVAFDWDGTVYSQDLPLSSGASGSAQSAWHQWGADHLVKYPYLFPAFKTDKLIASHISNIKRHDNYLEGRTFQPANVKLSPQLNPGGYDKFIQIAAFEQGMTLQQLHMGLTGFLRDYPPRKYTFTKMFDIMQHLQNEDFSLAIITGSSPYFVANLIAAKEVGINHGLNYKIFPQCAIHLTNGDQVLQHCLVIGNTAKLLKLANGRSRFSKVYDNRFVDKKLKPNQRVIIDGYGKQLALEQLSQKLKLPLLFYAGNSDGDFYAASYVLNNSPKSIALLVQPSAKTPLLDVLLKKSVCVEGGRCIVIKQPR